MGTVKKVIKSEVEGDPDIILVEFPSYSGKTIVYDLQGNEYPKLIPISI